MCWGNLALSWEKLKLPIRGEDGTNEKSILSISYDILVPTLYLRFCAGIEMSYRYVSTTREVADEQWNTSQINYSLLTKVVFSNNNVVAFVSVFSLMTCPLSVLYTTSVSATTKTYPVGKYIMIMKYL